MSGDDAFARALTAAGEPAPRLTPTQRLHEVTMAALNRAPSPPEHTVGLTLNAKGDVQIEVTGRGPELAGLAESVATQFDALIRRYPRAATPTNGGTK